MELRDRVFIITGGSSGIGAALAARVAAAGARVAVAGRRAERLEALCAPYGERALAVATDIGEHAQLEQLVARTVERFGRVDVLVNNAGTGYLGDLTSISPDEIERTIRVNLVAPIWLTRLCLPHLERAADGMIVNVISLSGLVAIPTQSIYCASKFGLSGFSKALRLDLDRSPVHVLSVYPGAVDTEMNTPEMRDRSAKVAGRAMSALSAERAADKIAAAIERRRRRVIVSPADARVLRVLASLAPRLVERLLVKARPALDVFGEMANQRLRAGDRRDDDAKGSR